MPSIARLYLHTGLTTLFVCLFSAFATCLAADDTKPKTDAARDDGFTVVLIPDTQLYSLHHPETYKVQAAWIKRTAKESNTRFAIHLGDIVHNDTLKEWKAAHVAHKILDGAVPYSMVPGNHDYANVGGRLTRDSSHYNQFFPPSRYAKQSWYGGHMGKTNDNNFCFFTGGGMKFMVVSLEFAPTDEALAWAGKIIARHADRRVIVATHNYMRPGGRDKDGSKGYRLKGNSGEQMWQKLIRKHSNVFLVVSGHVLGVGYQASTNDAGGKVHEMLTDYQGLPRGGNGYLRTMKFVPAENKVYVKTYSPLLDKENEKHALSFDYQMTPVVAKKAG